jgi:two-component system cell cycle response regulator
VHGGEWTASVEALLVALEARDPASAQHTRRVIGLSERMASRMGLSGPDVVEVTHVAALHDIGKLATPDSVLLRAGPLDEVGREIMRDHAAAGGRVVAKILALEHLAPAVRATHERWDGKGYPDGLGGATIPLASRIVFVCDAYDGMTSPRTYRPALTQEEAVAEIRRRAGTQFCPRSAETLVVLSFEPDAELIPAL